MRVCYFHPHFFIGLCSKHCYTQQAPLPVPLFLVNRTPTWSGQIHSSRELIKFCLNCHNSILSSPGPLSGTVFNSQHWRCKGWSSEGFQNFLLKTKERSKALIFVSVKSTLKTCQYEIISLHQQCCNNIMSNCIKPKGSQFLYLS